jgi:hypothetical protein
MSGSIFVNSVTAQPAAFEQRCGQQNDNLPNIDLIGIDTSSRMLTTRSTTYNPAQLQGLNLSAEQLHLNFLPDSSRIVPLQGGHGLAFLTNDDYESYRSDPANTLVVLTPQGNVLFLSEESESETIQWRRLSREYRPNTFALLGYDFNANAYLLDVTWTETSVATSNLLSLPFKLYCSAVDFLEGIRPEIR